MHKYQDSSKSHREYYERMLKVIGSLSRLFSENDVPFLHSRISEILYCKAFKAENKSRDDSSIDAKIGDTGIGIKTFVGKAPQKVAEFNRDLLQFSHLRALEKAKKIAELRNKRIEFAKRTYGINHLIYHCIRREKGKMVICESPMDLVDIENLKVVKESPKGLAFRDGKNSYNFNVSKSVLLKNFPKENVVAEILVQILADPFNILDKTLAEQKKEVLKEIGVRHEYVILPLYAIEKGKKIVPPRSGLNQWDAKGRPRDLDEVYIPIPASVRNKFPNFFPKRDVKFTLKLPDGSVMSAKVCQDNDKALMSDPNKALGQWILRKVLQLKRGKPLTYKMLQEIGIDSVIIKKTGVLEYSIDFKEEESFEKFKEQKLNVD